MPEETQPSPDSPSDSSSFASLLSEFEQSHSSKTAGGDKQVNGTIVAISADSVFIDIGFKTEGILPLTAFASDKNPPQPGDQIPVSVKGRNPEGYYDLTRQRIAQPKDWSAFQQAFVEKATILGNVTAVVKGGLTVDVGLRAFLPASRSGTRDAAELEKLVGQEIQCRITKLDVDAEDLVVDRRVVLEEQQQSARAQRFSEINVGDVLPGTVRTLTDYGAFVDLGDVDALLHIGDIAWQRIAKPSDSITAGQQLQVVVLAVDAEKRRLSVGLKQLQPHPWDTVASRLRVGDRVRGLVTRLTDFGAFVEIEAGVEGMIHVSEMSWAKKVRKPADMLKIGESVEVVILGLNVAERRMALGLKQTQGDPWVEMAERYPVGAAVEGTVTRFTKFGAFVQLTEGVEGMVHISEITAEKRIEHPQDVLRAGQTVQAQVIEVDREKRQFRLSMKRLIPTSLDEYLGEHKVGDHVTARVIDINNDGVARIELGQGIRATCRLPQGNKTAENNSSTPAPPDLSSLSAMLSARWKGSGATTGTTAKGALSAGQIREFRLSLVDPQSKKIEVEPV